MVLMEVMIALALIVMCILPLISPHAFLLLQQKKFISTIKLDHAVNLLYVDLLEKLHKNEIPWVSIQDGVIFPIDELLLRRLNHDQTVPFKGSFRIHELKGKSNDKERWGVHLIKITFSFVPMDFKGAEEEQKKQSLEYTYKTFIVRNSEKDPVNEDVSVTPENKIDSKDSKTAPRRPN